MLRAARNPTEMPRPSRKKPVAARPAGKPHAAPPRDEAAAVTRPARRRPESFEPDKYPNLGSNRSLERALRIHRAVAAGMTRDEATAYAEDEMDPPPRGRPAFYRTSAKGPRRAAARTTPRAAKR